MTLIPKIIHQTSRTKEIPEAWKGYQKKVRDLHPDWEYQLWTDEDNDRAVAQFFPQYLELFRGLPKGIMRADVIRYVMMAQHGGLYLDLDYEFLKPFDFLDKDVVLPVERWEATGAFVGNAVFASRPGHPYWFAVLEEWAQSVQKLPDYVTEEHILNTTGPGLLTRVYRAGFSEDLSIHLPEIMEFNPPIPRDNLSYERLLVQGTSYGIHHCHGTWRALTRWQRLWERIKKYLAPFKGLLRFIVKGTKMKGRS